MTHQFPGGYAILKKEYLGKTFRSIEDKANEDDASPDKSKAVEVALFFPYQKDVWHRRLEFG